MSPVNKQVANVAEAWPIYDTLCVTPQYFGTEADAGWFNNFTDFAQKEQHSFFMQRTIGNLDLAYTNKATADTLDFAYSSLSLGVSFFAPGVRTLGKLVDEDNFNYMDNFSAHWWESELPSHCAVQFKVQTDIVSEGPAMLYSPGYGPSGGGASFEHEEINATPPNGVVNAQYPAVQNWAMTQGIPSISNRFRFPRSIEIPRTATLEVIIHVSDYARAILTDLSDGLASGDGPFNYIFVDSVSAGVPKYSEFPSRYGIQVSLMGLRYVQQRGQYHS